MYPVRDLSAAKNIIKKQIVIQTLEFFASNIFVIFHGFKQTAEKNFLLQQESSVGIHLE